jgi:selenocysteine lyase/cysteine desulfurase
LPSQRHRFQIPADVTYLNCAYMSPLLSAVVEAGRAGVEQKGQPWTIRAADFFTGPDLLRGRFARLLGATADDIALVPSASYGMAVAATNLPLTRGQQVLVLEEAFPSMVYAWREQALRSGAELVAVPRPADDDWTSVVLERIGERTAIASLPQCHWTDGGLLDLVAIGARLREVGAALVVDASQSIGARPFALDQVQPDYLVTVGYKWLLGPYGLGYLYVAPGRQSGRPLEQTWVGREGSEDFAALTLYRDEFQPGARRFDAGESANFIMVPMAIAALEAIQQWGIPAIHESVRRLTDLIAERAAPLGLNAVPRERRAGHYLGLRFPDAPPAGLLERLAAQQVFVSVRGRALRVTPHLYNDEGDVDRLMAVLESVSRET